MTPPRVLHQCAAGWPPQATWLAYRFCVHEPGLDSVLFGTGNRDHLEANIDALLGPPLPEQTTARLRRLFGRIAHVSGN